MKKHLWYLGGILLLSLTLRLYQLNWDQGFHLHPDERAIILFTIPLHLPLTLSQFFSDQSPLNPHFFAYGSLPLYLLFGLSNLVSLFFADATSYMYSNLLGRGVSSVSDTITVALLFFIGKRLGNPKAGLVASLLYTLSVLPIQNAHFYSVDPLLTCFITLTIFQLISFYEKPTTKRALLIGLFLGLSLGTKNSALALGIPISMVLLLDFILILLKKPFHSATCKYTLLSVGKTLITYGLCILLAATLSYALTNPYTFLDFSHFWQQTLQQAAMTKSAFTFPYTLQYVNKPVYLYELQNIFWWGLGPLLATVSFLGILWMSVHAIQKKKRGETAQELIIMVYVWSYFLLVGHFAIGFMRYMLPIYPFLCLAGGFLLFEIFLFLKHRFSSLPTYFLSGLFLCLLFIWPLSFLSIYTKDNTRVMATQWILSHIPFGSALAIEHWDDSLPLLHFEDYRVATLALYNPDTEEKWAVINTQLSHTQFLIIASNRLSTPLQKLTDCHALPQPFCYPHTAAYYQKLFANKSSFVLIKTFSAKPTIPFTTIHINDDNADESFTVYDHPTIYIFQNTKYQPL